MGEGGALGEDVCDLPVPQSTEAEDMETLQAFDGLVTRPFRTLQKGRWPGDARTPAPDPRS